MAGVNNLNIPNNQKEFLKKLLSKAVKDQKAMFAVNLIIEIIHTVETLHEGKGQEILKGAHIVIENSDLFEMINGHALTRKRFSSHYRDTKIIESGVDIPSNADFLVGLAANINDRKRKFWMQLENTKIDFSKGLIKGAILAVLHLLDYIYYQLSGKNVGPCGFSEHVESRPIKIGNVKSLLNDMKPDTSKKLPNTNKLLESRTLLESRKDQSVVLARSY